MANYIAGITAGDLFELEPVEPYTAMIWIGPMTTAAFSQEYYDESLRMWKLVADTVENWGSYDTVFIGYPIWWGIAAWPTDGFVEANDFTGKTVIPFCTSSSSGLGESGELLQNWQAPEIGRKGCVSAPAPARQMYRRGLTA